MIYTNTRRRYMNRKLIAMYPDIKFREQSSSIPIMECDYLPHGAMQIDRAETLIGLVQQYCTRTNHLGMQVSDFSKTIPVFILSNRLDGDTMQHFFRVNYVSPSEASIKRASEYIAKGQLYAAPRSNDSTP